MKNATPAIAVAPPRRVQFRRSLWLFALIFAIGMIAGRRQVFAADALPERCSDFTPDNRPCTAMEELGYCLENAMESFDICKDGASFLGKTGCAIAYDVDFYACYLTTPVNVFFK
jgi:hypothetical protein